MKRRRTLQPYTCIVLLLIHAKIGRVKGVVYIFPTTQPSLLQSSDDTTAGEKGANGLLQRN